MAATITIFSQFPKDVVPHLQADLDASNWEWKGCLAFPVSKLNDLQFSSKPYKWIRYATGVVVGARGELCTERDSPNPVPIDYDAGLSAVSTDLYYHVSDEEKRRMVPIDRRLADTRTVTSSGASTGRENFREDVEERDGTSVVTGMPPAICEAAHILPHSKGDTYIKALSTHRRRESSGSDAIIQGIDDVRNGLFLGANIHRVLGQDVAFLKTPNFAMDTTDVDLNADRSQERAHAGCSGSVLRVPSDMSMWPPATLFDAIYAGAVVRHFGTERKDVLKGWEDVFYPEGATKAARTHDKRRRDHADAGKDGTTRQQRRGRLDSYDVLMIYRFKAMGPQKAREYLERCEEMAAAAERKTVEEKVNSWRDAVVGTP